jgi:CHAT domain-containing protein/tetratricopeptide (TPR) repeat protein
LEFPGMTPREVRAANDRIASLVAARRNAEALAEAERLLNAVSNEHGTRHGAVALQLQVLAFVQRSLRQPEAIESLNRALAIRTELFGADHPSIAATLRELSLAEHQIGHSKQALDHYLRAVAIWERTLPPGHPFFEQAEHDLTQLRKVDRGYQPVAAALAAYQKGQRERAALQYEAAQKSFELAVELNRQELGHDHPDVASCLRALGLLHMDLGELARAIPLLREALYISAQYEADRPRDYAIALSDLALALTKGHQHTEALELLNMALPLADNFRPSELSALATAHYAGLLREMGRYDEAEIEFRAILEEINSIVPAPERLEEHLAVIHSNMSSLAADSGHLRDAVLHNRKALDLKARAFGDRHPSYAKTLLNLAITYANAGDDRRATQMSDEALAILRETPGVTDLELSHVLMMSAQQATSPAVRAALCDEALAIYDKRLDEESPELEELRIKANQLRGDMTLAEASLRLADLRARTLPRGHYMAVDADLSYAVVLVHEALNDSAVSHDRLREAWTYLERAASCGLEVVQRADQAAFCLEHMALIEAILESPEAGLDKIRRAVAWEEKRTAQVFLIASERLRLEHAASASRVLGVYFSIFAGLSGPSSVDVDDAAAVLLNNKILSVDLASRPLAPSEDEDPGVTRLRSLKSRIAERLIAGFGFDADAMEQELDALVAERDKLESELAEAGWSVHDGNSSITPVQISAALLPSEAVLDFVAFEDRRGAWDPDHAGEPQSYGVFIHRADRPVAYVDLGPAAATDRDVERFMEAVGRPTSTSGLDPVREVVGRRLSQRLLIPLLMHLEGCEHLYIAPDAQLWALPYDALPLRSTELVIDRFAVSYVSSPRDLLQAPCALDCGPAVIIADPDFDLEDPGGLRLDEELKDRIWQNSALLKSGAAAVITFKEGRPDAPELPTYAALPGTRREAGAIAARLGVAAKLGSAATKKLMTRMRRPDVLHIASHGFFFKPGAWDEINMSRLASATTFSFAETTALVAQLTRQVDRLLRDGENDGGSWGAERAGQDPMALSGVVLAGANTWLRRGAPASGAGDGHFTAHDVAALDLRGTRLVVLSCCESARAAPQRQAGVFGLRRAFVLAGAQDLVLSLWRVSDDHTAALMIEFYDRFAEGLTPTDALRRAKLRIRKAHPDPYYWAAFTCQVGTPASYSPSKERA